MRSSPRATTARSRRSLPSGADTAHGRAGLRRRVSVDGSRVELEDGAKLDLGGIGKGYAAERAADILAAAGPCLVDAGGDVAVRGGHAWPVGVETGEGVVTLALERGALATSGSDRRRWTRGGEERHHLIDPRTGAAQRATSFASPSSPTTPCRRRCSRSSCSSPVPTRRRRRGVDGDRRHPQRRDDLHGRVRVRHDPTFWLLARASGMTAYVLVTLSVLAGLVLKSRPFTRLRPATVTQIHRALALNAVAAIAAHGIALVLDTTVKVSPIALAIPGLISYRPLATSLGVLAAELTILVYASFSLRRRIGFRAWRALHWATYGVFALAPCTASRPAPTPAAPGPHRSTSAPSERSRSRPPGVPSHRKENQMALYKVEIDRSLCSGYGICVDLAPDVIELDDHAEAKLRTAETDDAAVLAAADQCPMGAIRVLYAESDRQAA